MRTTSPLKKEGDECITLEALIESTLKDKLDGGHSEQKVEALRKALKRDAYFLDQEKKWLEEERSKF